MNSNNVFSHQVKAATEIAEYRRVKITSDGVEVAGAADVAIGHILQPVNGATPGRDIASIAPINGGYSIQFAVAADAIAVGGTFEAAADGEIQAEDSGTVLGIALEAATADQDIIRVAYYN